MSVEHSSYLFLVPLFFLVAFLYSSVGHGGASAYLAIFALFGITGPHIAPIVLTLNIIVACISFISFRFKGHFSAKLLLPFVITSIPLAYIGALVKINKELFNLILGIALILASIRVFMPSALKQPSWLRSTLAIYAFCLIAGGILGFLAGLIGIGGGVFLSPLILLFGLANAKSTAGISSAFIVLNSVSGLIGHFTAGYLLHPMLILLALVVLGGGIAGSFLGSRKIPESLLRKLLAVVLMVAGFKLLLTLTI